jgi:peptide deformylase
MNNLIITPMDAQRFPLLEMESQPCGLPLSDEDAEVVGYMDAALTDLGAGAVGLAAIQIGYPKRIFMLRVGDENRVFINPRIISQGGGLQKRGEACLSLPNFGVRIPRHKQVEIEYFNIAGDSCTEKFTGLLAQAVFHEMDHLNGVLLSHHLESIATKQAPRTKWGMKLTPHRLNVIANRRKKNKAAKAARKRQRQT